MKRSISILGADMLNLEGEIRKIEAAGADFIHLDFMDGSFVPNISLGLDIVRRVREISALPLDIHLMFDYPHRFIEKVVNLGQLTERDIITIHAESYSIVGAAIEKVRRLGVRAGLAISPKTNFVTLLTYFCNIDMLLIMGVEPGFGGQKMLPECVEKIKEIRKNFSGLIAFDGGVTEENEKMLDGVDIVIVGSDFWKKF